MLSNSALSLIADKAFLAVYVKRSLRHEHKAQFCTLQKHDAILTEKQAQALAKELLREQTDTEKDP